MGMQNELDHLNKVVRFFYVVLLILACSVLHANEMVKLDPAI